MGSMGRVSKLLIAVVCCGFLNASAQAQDLMTILQLALENDPTLNQAEAQYRANSENVIQTRASLLPTLGVGGTTARQSSGLASPRFDPNSGLTIPDHSFRPGQNSHNWGISLNQSVFNLANWYSLESAKASDRAGTANLAAQEQDLIMRTAAAYFDILRAQDLLETNVQEEEAALRSLEQTQQREEVGLVAITDVYDAQAAYDLARNTTILQQNALRASFEALEAITGQAHPNIEELTENFPIVDVEGTLEEWEDQAENNSLAIMAAKYNLDATQKNLKARRADHLPTVSFSGGFRHIVSAGTVIGGVRSEGGKFDQTSLSLSISVPLFSGGATSSRRRAAEYNVLAAEESLELTRRQLTQNIRNAYRRVNTDVLVIAQRQQSITSAQSALDATELGAEVGTRNIVEVLRARENLYRALRQYAEARYNYVIDSLVLKQVAGILTPQDVIELNQWLQEAN